MAKKCHRHSVIAFLTLLGLGACTSTPSPSTAAMAPFQPVADVVFHTDPLTGKTDGPFDKETGMRVLTEMGADGVMRVVRDPVSGTAVLLNEQKARTAMAPVVPVVATIPPTIRAASAAKVRSGPGTSFPVVTSVAPEMPLTPTGDTRNGWTEYRIQTPMGFSMVGWIADRLVKIGL
jgi:hypothetical protein